MPIRHPIQYELRPENIEVGTHWLALSLHNIGTEKLTLLDVRLNSLDAYSISVYGTGSYVSALGPDEEQSLPFQVLARSAGSLYVTLDGWRDEQPFHWESPGILIRVGKATAELTGLFALTQPYPRLGETVTCEATVRGLAAAQGLRLEFWVASPSREFENLDNVDIEALPSGEEARYAAEMLPKEEGLHAIYAYLYHNHRRIGYQVEHIYVKSE